MENQTNSNILSDPSVVQTPTTSQIQSKNNFLPIVTSALISAIIFGAIGYLIGKQGTVSKTYINDTQVQPPQTTTQNITPSPTSAVTTKLNLKTYYNQKLTLSFQYPKDFNIQNDSLGQMTTEGVVETSIQTNKNMYAFDQFVLLVVKSDDPLSKYVNDFGETQNAPTPSTKTTGAFSVTEWIGSYKNAPAFYYSFSKDGYIYNFGLVAPEDITKFVPNNEQVLEKIISTVKFQ